MNRDETPVYLCEVLDYKIIEDNYFTFIIAGAGAGKTTWARKVAQGRSLGQTSSVRELFLTPRTVGKQDMLRFDDTFTPYIDETLNVQLNRKAYFKYVYSDSEFDDATRLAEPDAYCIDNVAQTYSYFNMHLQYLKENYPLILEFGYAWLWNLFDIIVFDAVHVFMLEASYHDFTPVILDMITWLSAHKNDYPDKRIVFMSSTPKPILPTLKRICGKIKCINALVSCVKVMPQQITFINDADKMRMIGTLCANGHKVIDFYNGPARTIGECIQGNTIGYDDILSLVSKWNESRRWWKVSSFWNQSETVARMERAEEYMSKSNCLPPQYKYICATSAYAESVTWNNEDIDYVFVDSHILPRIVQCAGRLRKSKFVLVIVADSYQYDDTMEENLENCLADKETSFAGKSFGMYYDYLTGEYKYNQIKEDSLRYQLSQIKEWNNIDRRQLSCYNRTIRDWFGSKVKIAQYDLKEHQCYKAFSCRQFIEGMYYKESKLKSVEEQLEAIVGEKHRINTYLKTIVPGYHFERQRCGKHKDKYLFCKKR